jgi:Cu(I)/Ag(I) efflux system protein CusF
MMTLTRSICLAVLLAAPLAGASLAMAHEHEGKLAAPTSVELTDGEIKKVDKDAGKLTIKHGELKKLGMMPMTMVFKAADPAMLDQVAAGAKVRFSADKINGALTVTSLQIVK